MEVMLVLVVLALEVEGVGGVEVMLVLVVLALLLEADSGCICAVMLAPLGPAVEFCSIDKP